MISSENGPVAWYEDERGNVRYRSVGTTDPSPDPLLSVSTHRLVEELSRRPGCVTLSVEPHGRGTVGVDGPATCLVVLD